MTEAALVGAVMPPEPEPDGWEDPPRRSLASAPPVLTVDGFEGPLDWLLEMARTRRLDLGARVDPGAGRVLRERDAGRPAARCTGDGAVAVGRLDGDGEPAGRVALAAAAAGRHARHEGGGKGRQRGGTGSGSAGPRCWPRPTGWSGSRSSDATCSGADRQSRVGRGRRGAPGGREPDEDSAANDAIDRLVPEESDDLTELLRACLVALRLPAPADRYQPRKLPFWSVGDATIRICRLLPTLPPGSTLELFLPEVAGSGPPAALRRKAAHAATLIAGLELARDGGITLDQQALWQPIRVA